MPLQWPTGRNYGSKTIGPGAPCHAEARWQFIPLPTRVKSEQKNEMALLFKDEQWCGCILGGQPAPAAPAAAANSKMSSKEIPWRAVGPVASKAERHLRLHVFPVRLFASPPFGFGPAGALPPPRTRPSRNHRFPAGTPPRARPQALAAPARPSRRPPRASLASSCARARARPSARAPTAPPATRRLRAAAARRPRATAACACPEGPTLASAPYLTFPPPPVPALPSPPSPPPPPALPPARRPAASAT